MFLHKTKWTFRIFLFLMLGLVFLPGLGLFVVTSRKQKKAPSNQLLYNFKRAIKLNYKLGQSLKNMADRMLKKIRTVSTILSVSVVHGDHVCATGNDENNEFLCASNAAFDSPKF